MRRIALALLLSALPACAPLKTVPHEGPIEHGSRDQLIEQCQAQPQLDWCHHAK